MGQPDQHRQSSGVPSRMAPEKQRLRELFELSGPQPETEEVALRVHQVGQEDSFDNSPFSAVGPDCDWLARRR